jgi:SAM-dependent methyltransferase
VSTDVSAAGTSAGLREFFAEYWRPIAATRTPAIRRHLAAERERFAAILTAGGYATVVESGCADGRLLAPDVVAGGLRYLGVDLVEAAVREAREALGGRGEVVLGDTSELDRLPAVRALPPAGRLVAFPFNVIGNLPAPWRALEAARRCDADVAVFSYQLSAAADRARAAYFAGCGLTGEFRRDESGTHFRTGGTYTSSVYLPDVVADWLGALGYRVEAGPYGALGFSYHGTLG